MAGMMEFRTPGFKGYATKYSPFFDSRLALSASENFGLLGNGRLYILRLTEQGVIQAEQWYETNDALYDTAWSEGHENQIVAACGDGSVKLFDISANQFPIQSFHEHNREVYGLSWNLVAKDTFASSSWDGTIKIWSPTRTSSLLTLPTHSCTYSTAFSPHSPSVISSVSSDSHLRVFDLRTPASASNHLVHLIPIHGSAPKPGVPIINPRTAFVPSEALTHDWNKYRDTIVATAGVDQLIRTFDIRNPRAGPVAVLKGHEYAVRRIAWSPHLSDVLLSASYDMSCRVWTDGTAMGQPGSMQHPGLAGANTGAPRELGRMGGHTEFVTGVDWCIFGAEGWCASCAWDERLLVWDVRNVMGVHHG